jgi:hypothetical protein
VEHRQERTTYDAAESRQSVRRGRERGVWVFVPAAELRKTGIDPHDSAPQYKVWGMPKAKGTGAAMVRFYDHD